MLKLQKPKVPSSITSKLKLLISKRKELLQNSKTSQLLPPPPHYFASTEIIHNTNPPKESSLQSLYSDVLISRPPTTIPTRKPHQGSIHQFLHQTPSKNTSSRRKTASNPFRSPPKTPNPYFPYPTPTFSTQNLPNPSPISPSPRPLKCSSPGARLLCQDNMYFSHLFKIPSMGPSPKAQPKKSRNYRRKCAKKEGRDCTVEQEKGVNSNKVFKEEPTFRQVEDREKEESISQIEWTQD